MKGNGMNIEELLFDDAEKIEIDQDFKQSLKMRIMSQESESKVKVNRYSTKYLKIASGFVVVVLISGGIISMLKTGSPGTMQAKTGTEINTTGNGKTEIASMTKIGGDNNISVLPEPSSTTQPNNQVTPTKPASSDKPNVQNKTSDGPKVVAAADNNSGNTAVSNNTAGNSNIPSNTTGNNTAANNETNTASSDKGIQAIKIVNNEPMTRLPGVIGTPLSPGPDKSGQQSSSISPDGKYLTFEENNKIYMMKTGSDQQKVYVDDGNKPSWYITENIISYVKDEVEKDLYGKTSDGKSLYVEKHNSSIWIYDIVSGKKYKLMGSQLPDKTEEVKTWAESVKNSDTDQSFTIRSKETYLSTVWAQNTNKELFVVMNDNVLSQVEYFKLTLQIER